TYAVYFHPTALEALGDVVKPFLTEGPSGTYILCNEIDTGGSFCEMKVGGTDAEGKPRDVELMVPNSMIRLVISTTHAEFEFGFG
ncbi:MAG: hypothetical protein ABI588_03615, partial [Arenimonas sp.]